MNRDDPHHDIDDEQYRRIEVDLNRDGWRVRAVLRFDVFAGFSGFDIEPAISRPLDVDVSDTFTPPGYMLDYDFENDRERRIYLVRDFVTADLVDQVMRSETGTLQKFL